MILSRINIFAFSILLARLVVPLLLLAEIYLHVLVIAPVVYGTGPLYFVYLSMLTFVVANIIGNICFFVSTDTSIVIDSCLEPELNVKLCTYCDKNVPPRCTHCEHCNKCIPRRRGHCHLFGTCTGYFNHRYYFIGCVYCLLYSANAVAVSVIFYARMLRNCDYPPIPIDNFPLYNDYEDCHLLLIFFISALWNFFVLIFFIILLTLESEIIITGRMRHEIDTQNYDRGIRKNLICVLGKRWYLACLCPAVESILPDMHAVLFCVGERPLSFASRFWNN